ncbi:MAG: transcription termination factor Rho [Planctomycetota bacterium]
MSDETTTPSKDAESSPKPTTRKKRSRRTASSEDKPASKPAAEGKSESSKKEPAPSAPKQESQSQSQSNQQSGQQGGGGHQQHNQQQGNPHHQQGQHGQGQNRRKKKKKKRPGQQQGHQQGGQMRGNSGISPAVLPKEDDLERELAELEGLSKKELEAASKNALDITALQRLPIQKLYEFAEEEGLEDVNKIGRQDLIFEILKKRSDSASIMFGEGTLQIMAEGFGFLRSPEASYLASPEDIYVAPSLIRRLNLKMGMNVRGAIRQPKEGEKFFALLRVDEINGKDPEAAKHLPRFEDMTPLHPNERFVLETEPDRVEMRIMDLVAPIGRGQRALIVAPPRTGKTVLLQQITRAISKNYPDVKILVLLIDERPEEVTDFKRNTADDVEVIASTFDEDSSRHVQVAEMVIEKARRYVEFGEHCVILLDSITRLARAYNAAQPHSGKIMTGGIDSNALTRPKKFFGSARAIEDGGSLTILGTALVDTGSKADEVIFEEFKGTGNSELHLDRRLVEKRVYPAIDVAASGTRREELLLDPKELELVYRLRKVLSDMNVVEAMELIKSRIGKTKSNAEFLMTMKLG